MATTSFNIESNGTVRINIEPNDNDIKFKTENGAVSIGTTGTACLDLYFKLVRNIDNNGLLKLLTKSWEESPIDTMKLLFQSRDSRGGKGDRKPFLFAMQEFIIKKYPEWFIKNLENIPEYGRWLDLIEIVINKNLTDDIKQKIIELVANQLEKDYKSIKRDYYHVDATCMWMVKNPEWFDVIVTTNMFGDIITDLGAITQGGMGIAAGGNINPEGVSMFEPIGGSAPKYTGKNVINPLASISAGAMLLDHLGEEKAAIAIEKAIMDVTANKLKDMGAGRMGYSTTEVGDLVAERV